MNHRTMNRNAKRSSLRPITRPQGGVYPNDDMAFNADPKQPFLEDFKMEHCASGVTVKLIAFSAGCDTAESGMTRNSAAYQANLPSCVYLG
jgi:hypothetical protein